MVNRALATLTGTAKISNRASKATAGLQAKDKADMAKAMEATSRLTAKNLAKAMVNNSSTATMALLNKNMVSHTSKAHHLQTTINLIVLILLNSMLSKAILLSRAILRSSTERATTTTVATRHIRHLMGSSVTGRIRPLIPQSSTVRQVGRVLIPVTPTNVA